MFATMKTKVMTTVAFVFIVASSLLRSTFFPEADIFWGARNGMETLRNGIHIFQPDAWNLQTLGEEWSPNSWLWNVLLGGAYHLFGNYGFLLLTLITNVAAYGCLWAYLQKLKTPPLAALLILFGCWFIMNLFMNGRSNTADFLILTAFLYLCRHYLHKLIPLLLTSFLLTVLWMNLHLTGVAAAVIFPAVAYAIMHTEQLRKRLFQASLVLLSALAALPLTPYGLEGLIKVSMVKNESKGLIAEWSNVFQMPEANTGILLLLVVSLITAVFLLRKKQLLFGAFILVLAYGTYDTIRLTPFLLTVVLAALVFWKSKSFTMPDRLSLLPVVMSSLLILMTAVMTVSSLVSLGRVLADEESMFSVPVTGLSLIPENSRAAVSQDAGSAIILYRPDVLVSLDGRNDLIGAERFVEASNILYSDEAEVLESWLDEHDIDTVFVEDRSAVGSEVIADNMKALGWDVRTNETNAAAYVRSAE